MTIEYTVCQMPSERLLMLFGVAIDRVGRPDPVRPPPQHVVVPAEPQFFLWCGVTRFGVFVAIALAICWRRGVCELRNHAGVP